MPGGDVRLNLGAGVPLMPPPLPLVRLWAAPALAAAAAPSGAAVLPLPLLPATAELLARVLRGSAPAAVDAAPATLLLLVLPGGFWPPP